jgi:hypothetical protein
MIVLKLGLLEEILKVFKVLKEVKVLMVFKVLKEVKVSKVFRGF